jgi:uncharacterized membrane protein
VKLINRKNFISIVCICFTLNVLVKLIWEKANGLTDPHYTENIFLCFGIALLITTILAIHYYLQRFPFIPVSIGQYLITEGLILGIVWVIGHYATLAPTAYRDMFISVTIPFVICALVYYLIFFRQIRKANAIIDQLNQE